MNNEIQDDNICMGSNRDGIPADEAAADARIARLTAEYRRRRRLNPGVERGRPRTTKATTTIRHFSLGVFRRAIVFKPK